MSKIFYDETKELEMKYIVLKLEDKINIDYVMKQLISLKQIGVTTYVNDISLILVNGVLMEKE